MESQRSSYKPVSDKNTQEQITVSGNPGLNDTLKCMYTNADILTNKLAELEALIEAECPSIYI